MFNYEFYNSLPSVMDAHAAFLDRKGIFAKLAPILARDEYKNRYAVCLVHHHFNLKPGEWMVSRADRTTLPERIPTTPNPLVIPERWTAAGEPFEFKHVDSESEIVPPPPPSLLAAFRDALGDGAIRRVLGISLAGPMAPDGEIWCESTDDVQRRAHVVEQKRLDDLKAMEASIYETSWIPRFDGTGYAMISCTVCTSEGGCDWGGDGNGNGGFGKGGVGRGGIGKGGIGKGGIGRGGVSSGGGGSGGGSSGPRGSGGGNDNNGDRSGGGASSKGGSGKGSGDSAGK